jgi:Tfp pilus assembly protein PilW
MTSRKSSAGFTLVELLIGMSLGMVIMGGVLSSYIYLGRNFTRSLGISSSNQPNLETQARRTLAYFAQDVRMASGIVVTASPTSPSSTCLTLTLPTGTGTKNVAYYFNGTAAAVTVTLSGYSTSVPAFSLVRVDGSNGANRTLHSSLLTCVFNYYDNSGNPYPILDSSNASFSSFAGITQLAMTFTSQTGSSANRTLTQIYPTSSSRLLLRNKTLLP